MSKPKKGLGKGLGALLPTKTKTTVKGNKTITTTTTVLYSAADERQKQALEPEQTADNNVVQLPVSSVHPNPSQPRKIFDEISLDELAASLKEHGIIQPIIVTKKGKGYEIVAGERRYRAAQLAELKTVPAIVREYTPEEKAEIALIENLQREDLNVVDEANAYAEIIRQQSLTQEQLAKKLGRSRSHIANIMRLLKLPARVLDCLSQEIISMGQARPVLALEDVALQEKASNYIIDNDLSAREAEKLVKRLQKDPSLLEEKPEAKQADEPEKKDVFVTDAEDKLKLFFGTQVRIQKGKKKSTIEIEYYSDDDLNRILEVVAAKNDNEVEKKKAMLRQFSKGGKLTV